MGWIKNAALWCPLLGESLIIGMLVEHRPSDLTPCPEGLSLGGSLAGWQSCPLVEQQHIHQEGDHLDVVGIIGFGVLAQLKEHCPLLIMYAAQENPKPDAEIAKKSHFRKDIRYIYLALVGPREIPAFSLDFP